MTETIGRITAQWEPQQAYADEVSKIVNSTRTAGEKVEALLDLLRRAQLAAVNETHATRAGSDREGVGS